MPPSLQVSAVPKKRGREAPAGLTTQIVMTACHDALRKLDPRTLILNPVMFTVEVVAALTTILLVHDWLAHNGNLGFTVQIVGWLWFTVLFANFAEAIAEGRGKAQADALRKTRTDAKAKKIRQPGQREYDLISALQLKQGDFCLIDAGDVIPGDGDVVEGAASVDESAVTGESAPVIRESGGDRSAVTGGTKVLSDQIIVRISASQGSSFLDRMISLVEGAVRHKTPNEIALNILLAGLTIIFLIVVVTIPCFVAYAKGSISVVVLVALFVTRYSDNDRCFAFRYWHCRNGIGW